MEFKIIIGLFKKYLSSKIIFNKLLYSNSLIHKIISILYKIFFCELL